MPNLEQFFIPLRTVPNCSIFFRRRMKLPHKTPTEVRQNHYWRNAPKPLIMPLVGKFTTEVAHHTVHPLGWPRRIKVDKIKCGLWVRIFSYSFSQNSVIANSTSCLSVQACFSGIEAASGAEGGRFGEIAGGAPSADAVVTEQPMPPCGTSETVPAFLDYQRIDLYVSNKNKQDYCVAPSNGSTVWYFSYITSSQGGYFNYKPGETWALVVTMAYNSKDVNKLPVKGSTGLQNALDEMTSMIKKLQVKQR